MQMPNFLSTQSLTDLDATPLLRTPKPKEKVKMRARQSTIDSPSEVNSGKKSNIPMGRSHIPLPSLRRSHSKHVATVHNVSEPDRNSDLTQKDKIIRKLRVKLTEVEKERDEALRVLGEVQKMLGVWNS